MISILWIILISYGCPMWFLISKSRELKSARLVKEKKEDLPTDLVEGCKEIERILIWASLVPIFNILATLMVLFR